MTEICRSGRMEADPIALCQMRPRATQGNAPASYGCRGNAWSMQAVGSTRWRLRRRKRCDHEAATEQRRDD